MKKKLSVSLYISLAAGIIFILVGAVFLLKFNSKCETTKIPLISLILLVSGAVSLFSSIAITMRAFFLYLGLNLCFFGLLSLTLEFKVFDLTFYQIWPIATMFAGLSLIPSGYFRYRRIRPAYFFPSIVLVVLGGIFCLFSFDLIKNSFRKAVSRCWPLGLIILGAILIITFVFQKRHQSLFPYIDDDELDEFDEAGEGF